MQTTLEGIVAWKAAFAGAVFALLFVGERLFSATPAPKGWSRLARNGAMWLMLLILSPLIVLPLTAFASAHPLWTRPESWSGWPALAADIIIFDLWAYWVHRAYHEISPMRRLHIAHHLDEHLDTTSAVRFHPGEVALSAALRMVPIALLAIPFSHVVFFEALLLAASLFHHSNLRLPGGFERALSRIVVTPSIHWVHHHALWRDTNSNYAAIFSIWDPLFRSRSPSRREKGMKIGVEGLGDRTLLGLLLAPFQRTGFK